MLGYFEKSCIKDVKDLFRSAEPRNKAIEKLCARLVNIDLFVPKLTASFENRKTSQIVQSVHSKEKRSSHNKNIFWTKRLSKELDSRRSVRRLFRDQMRSERSDLLFVGPQTSKNDDVQCVGNEVGKADELKIEGN